MKIVFQVEKSRSTVNGLSTFAVDGDNVPGLWTIECAASYVRSPTHDKGFA